MRRASSVMSIDMIGGDTDLVVARFKLIDNSRARIRTCARFVSFFFCMAFDCLCIASPQLTIRFILEE